MLTFVVAGAGFSGVELAAELNDFVREVSGEYHHLDPSEVRVILLHSGERILPELSEGLALYAQRKLAQRGIEIQLKKRLAAATATEVILTDGSRIDTRTLVVAIGASPNSVVASLPFAKERGQLVVNEYLEVDGQTGVWALGDCARIPEPKSGQPGRRPRSSRCAKGQPWRRTSRRLSDAENAAASGLLVSASSCRWGDGPAWLRSKVAFDSQASSPGCSGAPFTCFVCQASSGRCGYCWTGRWIFPFDAIWSS